MSRSTSKDKDKMQDLGTVMLCSMAEMGGTQTASGLASPATSSTQMVLVSVPLGGLVGVI